MNGATTCFDTFTHSFIITASLSTTETGVNMEFDIFGCPTQFFQKLEELKSVHGVERKVGKRGLKYFENFGTGETDIQKPKLS